MSDTLVGLLVYLACGCIAFGVMISGDLEKHTPPSGRDLLWTVAAALLWPVLLLVGIGAGAARRNW